MPLVKGRSKRKTSGQLPEAVLAAQKLFSINCNFSVQSGNFFTFTGALRRSNNKRAVALNRMFHMFNRMTIWTKNFQIFKRIVFCISVFMMNTKYFFFFIITTSIALFNHSPNFHVFSNMINIFVPFFKFIILRTFLATKFSFFCFRRRCKKFGIALLTFYFNSAFVFHRFIITNSRAIFCALCPRNYMFKQVTTNSAICGNFCSFKQAFTFLRTKFCSANSVWFYINKFTALKAWYILSVEGH